MGISLRKTAKNSMIYSLGGMLSKLVGFLLLPIYTSHFTVSEYGVLGLLEVSSQVLISIVGLNLYRALIRWYWDKEFIDEQKSIVFTVLVFLSLIISFVIIIIYFAASNLATFLLNNKAYTLLLRLVAVSAGFEIIIQIILTLMRLQERALTYVTTSILKLIISLSLTVYFIIGLNKGVESIYQAQIVGALSFLVFVIPFIKREIVFKFNGFVLKEMLAYSLPLVLSSISGLLLSFADRYSLKFLTTLKDVGLYALGYKLANTIRILLVQPVLLALTPVIYKEMNNPGNKEFYSKIMNYFTMITLFLVLALSIFGKEIIVLVAQDQSYFSSYKIIPIISFGIFFGMLKEVAVIGINIRKKTKVLATIVTLVSVLNLILNIILIPFFQTMGAGIATLFSQVVFFIVVLYYAQKYYPIPYHIKELMSLAAVAAGLISMSYFFAGGGTILHIGIKVAFILAFPLFLFLFRFIHITELRNLFRNSVKK